MGARPLLRLMSLESCWRLLDALLLRLLSLESCQRLLDALLLLLLWSLVWSRLSMDASPETSLAWTSMAPMV